MAKQIFSIAAAMALGACGQASALPVDPSNDLHCSVVAFYFKGDPITQAAPQNQRDAIARIFDWYTVKTQALAAEQGPDAVLRTAAPALEAVKKDPAAHREHLLTCTNRAVDDPTFNAWLRSR